MTQIENEYGNYGYTDWPRDKVKLLSYVCVCVYCVCVRAKTCDLEYYK